ncbi:Endo-beta-mannanase [Urinicoccus massiliensis]|uniref:Endo-beta-mannanase n=1 Tax=Urinicoccus massiliensis TaxID=1723382 RepID=A0A8H2M5Y0_9FIRM|nr:S-layer homology domain-containing protein [Urinicoccus massiliensis]VFB17044.1 Endo-beta-mannanase [Urinicoccus massiliensis]
MNKKILSLFLAIVMVLGMVGPAFAAGSTPPDDPKKAAESELIADKGKLKAKLSLPKTEKREARPMIQASANSVKKAPLRTGPEPEFGETKVTVNIAKHGIGTKPFDFDAVFGATPNTKVTLINWNTDETQEATFDKNTQSVTFNNPVSMKDMKSEVYGIEFEGTNVAGKITFKESTPDYSGGENVTTFTLDLYQVRNTDVIVKTVDLNGAEIANPTTTATNGKIKLGSLNKEIDIPAKDTAGVFVEGSIRVRDVDKLNANPNYSIEGLENGVLVDKANNKVYKPGEFVVDEAGIDATTLEFTEKPIWTTDDMSGDTDYVKVDFAAGDHGTLETNPIYYVFKGVTIAGTLTAPNVIANVGYEHTGWNPGLATKYDVATTHVARYSDEIIGPKDPTKPDGGNPDKNLYWTVTFKSEDTSKGTVAAANTVYVLKTAKKTLADIADKAPATTPVGNHKFDGWNPPLDKNTAINKDLEVTAKFAPLATVADKDKYEPNYENGKGKPGATVTIPAPTFKDSTGKTVEKPTDGTKTTTFTKNDDKQTNVTVNPNTGAITVKIPADAEVGSKITIPVDVTYPDGSKETVKVTVTVVDNEQPSKPTIENPAAKNEKGKDSTTVTGKTKPNTKVTVTDEKGNKIGEGTSDPDGNFTIQTNPKQEKGKKVTLTPEGGDGIKVTVTEDETPDDKPSAPSITWRGLWFLGGNSEPAKTSKEMETGRHYKYLYGYVDKTVRPEGMITRSEAAALIARLAELDMSDKTKPNFKDAPSAWYNSAINAMVSRNLMFADKNGNFRPNEPITRGEFARALYYIDKKNDKVAPFADVKGHEFEEAINQAYGNGRIAGYPDGTFKPDAKIQRAEAARILNQYADRNVTLVGMANVKRDLVRFTDINESHWAYCEVMEAANSHEYQREKGTLAETWLRILDK